jgi:hypothetical protein
MLPALAGEECIHHLERNCTLYECTLLLNFSKLHLWPLTFTDLQFRLPNFYNSTLLILTKSAINTLTVTHMICQQVNAYVNMHS